MIARNITQEQIHKAALNVGVRLVNERKAGRGFAFTLGLEGELWRRKSPSGWKVAAVCYHGYTAFMRELYALAPAATLISKLERFDGVDDFKAKACAVGDTNFGSNLKPLDYSRACFCTGDLALADV